MQYFVGDRWQPHSNLTLNFGLRYQPLPKPSEVSGLHEFPYDCDCNNVAGTFGFAYRMPGPWGVFRGAYGTHYSDIIPSTYEQIRFNAPATVKPDRASVSPIKSVPSAKSVIRSASATAPPPSPAS